VAKVACSDNIGDPRYYSLKLEKTYNALRLLYLIENRMFLTLKKYGKLQKKNQMIKRRRKKLD
jgi:hypothetical protein